MQAFRRNSLLVLLSFLTQLLPFARLSAEETVSWRRISDELQRRVEIGALGEDVSITFQNSPHGKYLEDELMAYTFSSDGTVVIQMNDQVKTLKVPPEELLWLAKFLVEHKLAELPEKEARIPGSASFALNMRVGGVTKGSWFYNSGNDRDRESLWQYCLRFGQLLLENAGLREKELPILPVCLGIIRVEDWDNNNDGVIEWQRLVIGFHAFKAGEFTFDFSGVRHKVFLAQGRTEKTFFLNTYLLHPDSGLNKECLNFFIDSRPPYPGGAYSLGLGLDDGSYARKRIRTAPDFVFTGLDKGEIGMRLRQAVIVEIKKNRDMPGNKLLRFSLAEIVPTGVRLVGKDAPVSLAWEEKFPIEDFGCVSCQFWAAAAESVGVVFEVGWDIPEKEVVRKKIEYFQEALANDDYPGDKETARLSWQSAQECFKQLEETEDLRINVIYATPAEVN